MPHLSCLSCLLFLSTSVLMHKAVKMCALHSIFFLFLFCKNAEVYFLFKKGKCAKLIFMVFLGGVLKCNLSVCVYLSCQERINKEQKKMLSIEINKLLKTAFYSRSRPGGGDILQTKHDPPGIWFSDSCSHAVTLVSKWWVIQSWKSHHCKLSLRWTSQASCSRFPEFPAAGSRMLGISGKEGEVTSQSWPSVPGQFTWCTLHERCQTTKHTEIARGIHFVLFSETHT